MVKYYLESNGIKLEVTKKEFDIYASCGDKYSLVLGGKLFKVGTQVTMREVPAYKITNLDLSWSTLVKDLSNTEDPVNIHLTKSTSLDYKYASPAPVFSPGVSIEPLEEIKTKSSIIFTCASSVILGTTSGYQTVAQNMKITSSSLTFSGCIFNGVDLSWSHFPHPLPPPPSQYLDAPIQYTPAPMLTLINGGTVDSTSMTSPSKIYCNGDMSTTQFNLTYSHVTVDGSVSLDEWWNGWLTLDDFTYGQWPVIDALTQSYTTLTADKLIYPGLPQTVTDLSSLIGYLRVEGINRNRYSIGHLSTSTNNIDISYSLFGKGSTLAHYTINVQQNRMFYYKPGVTYEFVLNKNTSAHPLGFVSNNSSSLNVTYSTYNLEPTSLPLPVANIPELSSANHMSKNQEFFKIINSTKDGSLHIAFNPTYSENIFLYCGYHGTMASPLVLIPKPYTSPNECQPSKICNVCSECCADYITDGPQCDLCVSEKCPSSAYECQPAKGCNVCSECCADYIADGPPCDSCVKEKCPALWQNV